MQLKLWMSILFSLGSEFGNLFIFAYILTKVKAFGRIVSKKKLTLYDKILLSIIFGIFGIVGTYFSFEYNGALINTRLIGIAAGGLFGGPIVGTLSGLIAGIHRGSLNAGTVTSFACAVSTIFEGMMAGFMGHYIIHKETKWPYAILTGIIGESMRKIALLILVKPFHIALSLVKDIWIPMVLINSIGLTLFFLILENTFKDRERLQAESAQLSLKIIDEALPYIRMGFDSPEFSKVTKIIYARTEFDAITLTNTEKIIAHVGIGTPRHKVGNPLVTYLTASVFESNKPKVLGDCYEDNCEYLKTCPLKSTLTLPLSNGDEVIGTLKFYKSTTNAITELDVELGEGIAKLISTEMRISKLERTEKLLQEAEFRALQSQINPHFLFNSLTVIGSICRTEPSKARDLIYSLSRHFRKNLNNTANLVSIWEEIDHVEAYVSIEKARLNEDLCVIYKIDQSLNFKIPPLTLQPIVENAVKHGIYPKKGKGIIHLSIHNHDKAVVISIADDGVGMDKNVANGILNGQQITSSHGTRNVIERLKTAYGESFTMDIQSEVNRGTKILFKFRKVAQNV